MIANAMSGGETITIASPEAPFTRGVTSGKERKKTVKLENVTTGIQFCRLFISMSTILGLYLSATFESKNWERAKTMANTVAITAAAARSAVVASSVSICGERGENPGTRIGKLLQKSSSR